MGGTYNTNLLFIIYFLLFIYYLFIIYLFFIYHLLFIYYLFIIYLLFIYFLFIIYYLFIIYLLFIYYLYIYLLFIFYLFLINLYLLKSDMSVCLSVCLSHQSRQNCWANRHKPCMKTAFHATMQMHALVYRWSPLEESTST